MYNKTWDICKSVQINPNINSTCERIFLTSNWHLKLTFLTNVEMSFTLLKTKPLSYHVLDRRHRHVSVWCFVLQLNFSWFVLFLFGFIYSLTTKIKHFFKSAACVSVLSVSPVTTPISDVTVYWYRLEYTSTSLHRWTTWG